MKFYNFEFNLDDNKDYKPLEISSAILNEVGGLYFLDICKDFNAFNWCVEMLYGDVYEENNLIYIKLSEECKTGLHEMKDENMTDEEVDAFIYDIENNSIGTVSEDTLNLIDPNNQENVDIYVIFRDGAATIYALYAATKEERFLNRAVIYADMFEFCGVRNTDSLKFFLNVVEKEYMNYFNEEESPFDILPQEAQAYEFYDGNNIDNSIMDDFEKDDYEYLDLEPEQPTKIIPFPRR